MQKRNPTLGRIISFAILLTVPVGRPCCMAGTSGASPPTSSPTASVVQSVIRGQTTALELPEIPADSTPLKIQLDPVVFGGTKPPPFPAPRSDIGSLLLNVPSTVPVGSYSVMVVAPLGGVEAPAGLIPSGRVIEVVRNPAEPLEISAVYPSSPFPSDKQVAFSIIGDGFSPAATDNILSVDGRGILPISSWATGSEQSPQSQGIVARLVSPHEIDVWGLPAADYRGPLNARVQVGTIKSKPFPFTVSTVERNTPLLLAVLALVALVIIAVVLGRWKSPHTIAGKNYSLLSWLLLDPETDTYSLSKFQFYLWSAAVAFSYVYLCVIRWFVQAKIGLPELPPSVPGILGISAATTVAAVGVTTTRGPKGAGAVQPSLADLITSGGVVVAERFQFFIWTLLGVAGFLVATLSVDPAILDKLLPIPEGLLYLMGISSSSYLGGKLVRKAGPVIDSIIAQLKEQPAGQKVLAIDIKGRELRRDGTIRINNIELSIDLVDAQGNLPVTPPSIVAPQKDARLQLIANDPNDPDPNAASLLRLTVMNASKISSIATGLQPPQLTLVNPDGKFATWPFNEDWNTLPSKDTVSTQAGEKPNTWQKAGAKASTGPV